MNLKVNDKVIVIAGTEKGKTGTIKKVLKNENRVIIDQVNLVKKHMKPDQNNQNGGIIEIEAPIHASNVMILDPKTKKGTRIKKELDKNNKKIRVCVKSNEKIDYESLHSGGGYRIFAPSTGSVFFRE